MHRASIESLSSFVSGSLTCIPTETRTYIHNYKPHVYTQAATPHSDSLIHGHPIIPPPHKAGPRIHKYLLKTLRYTVRRSNRSLVLVSGSLTCTPTETRAYIHKPPAYTQAAIPHSDPHIRAPYNTPHPLSPLGRPAYTQVFTEDTMRYTVPRSNRSLASRLASTDTELPSMMSTDESENTTYDRAWGRSISGLPSSSTLVRLRNGARWVTSDSYVRTMQRTVDSNFEICVFCDIQN